MQIINISDLSILLIEPSAVQLKVIVQHLQSEGIDKIDGVPTVADAWQFLEKHQPDLIISSMYLADGTAATMLERLKQDSRYSHIPFMLVSSESGFAALDAVRQAGVVAILPKPFAHDDLKNALRASIEFIDPQEINLAHYDTEHVRVLVVDDSPLARKHICRVLNNMGITNITTASDGQQAVEIFSSDQNAFDLIVTDFNMPVMDGQQLVETVRSTLGNSVVPILMVTSENNETRLSNVLNAGVSAICDKPFDPQTVKEMLYRVFETS